MRTNPRLVDAIVRGVEEEQFGNKQYGIWILCFLRQLERFGRRARQDTPRGKDKATDLAFHLAMLIDDPRRLRKEEEEHQEERKRRYFERVAVRADWAGGREIAPEDIWEEGLAALAITDRYNDAIRTNRHLRRLVVAFGLLDILWAALLDIHAEFGEDKDTVFTEESWPHWRDWAVQSFFAEATELPLEERRMPSDYPTLASTTD